VSSAWYALRVRSNFEQTTATFLTSIGYQAFLPTYRERRRWSDRSKEVDTPLFPGYVFCHMDVDKRQVVVRAPGFLKIVSAGSTFLAVADAEIAAVRMIVNSPVLRTPWPYVCVGDMVVIDHGPLAGLEGILLEERNEHRLIVSVHLLQRSVAAEVSREWVRPVKESLRMRFDAARCGVPAPANSELEPRLPVG
jgi:transcription antitermination factor NusG